VDPDTTTITDDEFCTAMSVTHKDIAEWRSEVGFSADLEAACKDMHRQRGVPRIISTAFARSMDTKQSGEEQRRWMFVFLKLVESPLGKPSIFAE